ncbi:DUF2515 family protein [Paenibacillus sp. Marseille-P2973]|uniref:DUF2515 family protein n=1 Tax=Paenibacillus TaxID=44249 RepID=UPI001B372C83|nr:MULTISPECIES: DUF2515 family protein [Paenibacillus]MBQ4901939.1 DUF2515 family protein [Paenibacillus sp. Marseille-P2973]MDN4067997.1 DUF2515 family protein [Paenibacillus vini]
MKQSPRNPDGPASAPGLKDFLRRLPSVIGEAVKGKAAGIAESSRLREERLSLEWNEASARTVATELEDLLRRGPAARAAREDAWSEADRELAEEIALATGRAGASNITRTEAYLACYQAYPELHWAFLAHMVSRNAGWNMTDLRGRLADLLDESEKKAYYRFLERSNALIFQDAYPQLLLYIKSRELGSSRFHLLPYFHVSEFMRPFWERFWIDRGSALLTVGLIINEQNYIEKRVIRHPYYQKHITDKLPFHLNSLAGLNQVVFPLLEAESDHADGNEQAVKDKAADVSGSEDHGGGSDPALVEGGRARYEVRRLAGRVVSDFGSLPDRIALGKSLYAMLMGLRAVRSGAERFAVSVPHSGSRGDYWPELFTANSKEALTSAMQGSVLLEGETLPPGMRLFSPKLLDAWGDTPYEPISREDWLKDHSALDGISAPQPPYLCDISREHRGGILKAALAHDVAGD